jgi:hypothetical protein
MATDIEAPGTEGPELKDALQKLVGVSAINVRDYGAVGNGSTDDTSAIQAAVDWCTATEVTTAGSAAGSTTLTFGGGVPQWVQDFYQRIPIKLSNSTTPASLNGNTEVTGVTATTVTISVAVVDGNPVGSGDSIYFYSNNRGVIYFPLGEYKVTSSITYPGSTTKYIEFLGEPGAEIVGSVTSDAILKRAADSPYNGIVNVRNLKITNSHATGKGITIHSCIGAVVSGCHISAHIGVETYNSQAVTVEHCNIVRSGQTLASSIGIMAGNATSVLNCDVVSYDNGIRHYNVGLTVVAGRYEVNGAGIVLGVDQTGAVEQSSNVLISGVSMEQNDTHIYIASGAAISLVAVGMGSGQETDYGLNINGGNDICYFGGTIGSTGGFSGYAVNVASGTRLTFINVNAASWNFTSSESMQFINCNQPLLTYTGLPSAPVTGSIHTITDGTGVSIGGTVSGGGGSDDYVLCRGASAWVRIA